MKKTTRKTAAKAARPAKAPARRAPLKAKAAPPLLAPEEAEHLEQISLRYAQAELAWQRMSAVPEGAQTDVWAQVEDHLLKKDHDAERSWKYFAK